MARYKDVEPLDFMNLSNKSDEFCEGVRFALEEIDKLPTADVVEVKHGEWDINGEFCQCSVCDNFAGYDYDYCPYCGAKMDGERK